MTPTTPRACRPCPDYQVRRTDTLGQSVHILSRHETLGDAVRAMRRRLGETPDQMLEIVHAGSRIYVNEGPPPPSPRRKAG